MYIYLKKINLSIGELCTFIMKMKIVSENAESSELAHKLELKMCQELGKCIHVYVRRGIRTKKMEI